MTTTSTTDASPRPGRLSADRQELADRIARAVPRDGVVEPVPGLFLTRCSAPGDAIYGVIEPSLCLIAQGAKDVLLGDRRYRYDPAHYLIATVGVPAVGRVIEATRGEPYLGARLVLDPAVVTSVIVEAGGIPDRSDRADGRGGADGSGAAAGSGGAAIDASPLDADLLDATLRLVRLIDRPAEHRVLGPLVVREIVYRLLTGAQGDRLRHLAAPGGRGHRMARAVALVRAGFDKPLRVEALARELGMSVSGFHAHFKAVTNLSPLQFQKHLRLQEARRLMLGEGLDAAEAGYRVGYDDPAYFSRDYKRHFGEPPARDVERLREMATA